MTAQVGPHLLLQDLPATRGVIEVPGVRELLESARVERARRVEQARRQAEIDAKAAVDAERERAEQQERERLQREWAERLETEREQDRHRAEERARTQRAQHLAHVIEEADRRRALWRAERSQLERRIGLLPTVIEASVTEAELAVTTGAPDQWRWAVLSTLQANQGFTVNPRGLRTLIPRVEGIAPSQVDPLVAAFLVLLRAEGWVWFWGARRPRDGEAVRVLTGVGASRHPPAPARLSPLRSGRVAGPGPGGDRYLDPAGMPSFDLVEHSRDVGRDAALAAAEDAYREAEHRAIRTALGGTPPKEQADSGAAGAPNLTGVHRALPDAANWCVSRDWPIWRLPARLHEAARLTFYVLAVAYRDQPQAHLRLGDCSPDDALAVLEELRRHGYVGHGALGWQATYGGVL